MTPIPRPDIDWVEVARSLEGMPLFLDPRVVRAKSKDYYWYSPVLKRLLDDKTGDLVVFVRSEDDVLRVARTCVRYRAPLTVRGAGTGNYGQAIPLAGGVVLDTTRLNRVLSIDQGVARVQAGVKLLTLDAAARRAGWELRVFPSTKRTATVGGFVAGGSGGVGSIAHDMLAHGGNLRGLRVITMEDEPRPLELRGQEVLKVHHAYGTNGIVVEVELPLAPAQAWLDLVVAFDDFLTAVRFSQALGEAGRVAKKLISTIAWPIPRYFTRLVPPVPRGQHAVLLMVAEPSLDALEELCRDYGGTICCRRRSDDLGRDIPLYEYTWNHTTLHALRADPSMTYLQSLFPAGRNFELIEHMYRHFGDEVLMHLETVRFAGRITQTALPLVRFTTEERLNEIIAYHEAHGVLIFNPHTYVLEDGGMKVVDENQLAFKRRVDPYGLMNPGKMRAWMEQPARD